MACHATGAANAPKYADKAAWAPRIKQGLDALHASALKGKGAMPPKGGNPALSDAAVRAAVDYLVAAAK
jgi:cytochrome c5